MLEDGFYEICMLGYFFIAYSSPENRIPSGFLMIHVRAEVYFSGRDSGFTSRSCC